VSPEAFGFLVERGESRLFYTGDFRAHGRKQKVFEKLLANPPADIDALVMEGTMIQRENDGYPSEESVEKKIFGTIQGYQGISFLICSAQNIDRLVGAYGACLDAKKILVVDLYTAWVLEQLKLVSQHVPNIDWDIVRVYISGNFYERTKQNRELFGGFTARAFRNRVKEDELNANPGQYLFVTRAAYWQQIKNFQKRGPIKIIYSQWLGYLDEKHCHTEQSLRVAKAMNELRDVLGDDFVYAHTSGHAVVDDLKRLVTAMKPRVVIPIHTEYGDEFKRHFPKVKPLQDGEEYDL